MHNFPGQLTDCCILPLLWSSPPSTDLSNEIHAKALSHGKEGKVVLGEMHESLCLLVFQNTEITIIFYYILNQSTE